MNNSQFKFKPDKIKYLSNIDTLDSNHKKIIDTINKKREERPKKTKRLEKIKNDLINLDHCSTNNPNFITLRSKLLDEISKLEDDLNRIENYDDELEYYSKTHQILFNYYDIIDGQNSSELKENSNSNSVEESTENKNESEKKIDKIVDKSDKVLPDEWNFDGIEIFNNKSNKLDLLNQISKLKRKEKKTTRKRVKNIESLIKDNNNNIFDYIHKSSKLIDDSKLTPIPIVYDRATLYEDYKILLEGYTNKKKTNRPCINCDVDKVLIYSEGIYACMKCGEVENCIVESEITNYKDPMIEKPTFPYKRKNHFCEWNILNCSLKLILKKLTSFFSKLYFI